MTERICTDRYWPGNHQGKTNGDNTWTLQSRNGNGSFNPPMTFSYELHAELNSRLYLQNQIVCVRAVEDASGRKAFAFQMLNNTSR